MYFIIKTKLYVNIKTLVIKSVNNINSFVCINLYVILFSRHYFSLSIFSISISPLPVLTYFGFSKDSTLTIS